MRPGFETSLGLVGAGEIAFLSFWSSMLEDMEVKGLPLKNNLYVMTVWQLLKIVCIIQQFQKRHNFPSTCGM